MNSDNISVWSTEQNEFFKNNVIGKTVVDIRTDNYEYISFLFDDGSAMRMYHSQNCCESVTIDDICGDLEDLIGTPILIVELRTNFNDNPKDEYDDSFTWSFYTFRTLKGTVDIRWYGTSNGYYSEDVDIEYHPSNIIYNNWQKDFFNKY